MPLNRSDRVASRLNPGRHGVVLNELGQPLPGKPRILEVRWDDGELAGVSEDELIELGEKRGGLGSDVPRCPKCKYPLPSHAPSCKG